MLDTTHAPPREREPRRTRRRWALWPYRILISVVAVLFFMQAVLAGQFLSGTFGSLQWHQDVAALADMVLFVTVPAAILARWPGRGPTWPIAAVPLLIVISYTQSALGFSRTLTIHIPLGVAIIMVSSGLAVLAWRANPRPEEAPC